VVSELKNKSVLIELLVANPPTRKCREFIDFVMRNTKQYGDLVDIKIYRKGTKIPPGYSPSAGLLKAAKRSAIPAIIINSEVSFVGTIPKEEDFKKKIEDAMKREGLYGEYITR